MFSRIVLRREDPASNRSSTVDDLESQPLSPTETSFEPEMAERGGHSRLSIPSRFRFSSSTEATSAVSSDWPGTRTARTSRLSRSLTHPAPRPTSSRYPEDDDYLDLESQWAPNVPPLPTRYSVARGFPSSRLDLPSWTQEKQMLEDPYKAPPYPPVPTVTVTEPAPVAQPNARRSSGFGHDGELTELFGEVNRAYAGVGLDAADPAEEELAGLAEDGRRRRHKKHRSDRERSGAHRSRKHGHGHGHGHGHRHRHRRDGTRQERTGNSEGRSDERKRRHKKKRRQRARKMDDDDESEGPHPRHFMFCFPWVRNRKMRSQILQCVVSSLFLICLLAVYLALSVTKNIKGSEFTVLMVLVILVFAIFFLQALVRLCMLIHRRKASENERRRHRLPKSYGPSGYAVPRKPIRVVLARDEEAVGIESETTKTNPPAYGLWRESVRVDPNQIYWQRNPEVAKSPTVEEGEVVSDLDDDDDDDDEHRNDEVSELSDESEDEEEALGDGGRPRQRGGLRRPPSYVSEDGVSYIVEARPRSMAPMMDVPLPVHPAEAGRVALPPRW
ncbi:hypothetical protein VMCG_07558 [Cytospora schulzeri]|uniref:Uncharacterized protein n=1 Tax=Cytospora schulzeri TaxID=448051 RepID=A0A423VXC2_9PEZI|nr:hypothetical protein VMCG_07558 [Valsa malicola]